MLGWVDHVSDAIVGAAAGLVLAGTSSYALMGGGIPQLRDALSESVLASGVSRVSLISSSKPWFGEHFNPEGEPEECNSLKGLAKRLASDRIINRLNGILGHDVDHLIDVVQGSLSGPTENLVNLVGDRLPQLSSSTEPIEAAELVNPFLDQTKGGEAAK